MTIKEMTECEVPAVANLEQQIFSMPWSKQGFRDTLAMENVIFLVALKENSLCGYCGIYLAADEGEITNVAVAPEYRRQGIAEGLVTAIMSKTFPMGVTNYILEVRASNEPAKKLYEKIGFEVCGTRKNFYEKPKEDALVMSCTPAISTVR